MQGRFPNRPSDSNGIGKPAPPGRRDVEDAVPDSMIVQLLDKLEFGGQCPLTMRARCTAFRYCPNPLGIVSAEQLDKLEFISVCQGLPRR